MNLTEIAVGALGLLGSVVLAFFAYRRGTKADKAVQENIAIANENNATATVVAGYGSLLQRIQQDNRELRERLAAAEARIEVLAGVEKRLEAAEARIERLLEQLGKGA